MPTNSTQWCAHIQTVVCPDNTIFITHITYFKFRFPNGRKASKNRRLKQRAEAVKFATHMMHHRKNAIVDELAVTRVVLQEKTVLIHYICSCEPINKKVKIS